MKFAIVLALLAVIAALALAQAQTQTADSSCDINANGMPDCTADSVSGVYRNNWDPTHYWECPATGGAAVLLECNSTLLYDSSKKMCVPWNEWTWTPVC